MNSIPNTLLTQVVELRRALHACPEPSGHESRTMALLKQFLTEHTSMEIHDCGPGFYAAHREGQSSAPGIAFRADYDALPLPEGGAAHLCGHDGHAATLCGVALMLENMTVGRDVYLLFQPAEETGEGAKACLGLFAQERVGEIYGAHNLPGFPFGEVFTCPGTFAYASRGLALTMQGISAHAAYPENGKSPAGALGRMLCGISELAQKQASRGSARCTIIGARLGEESFGTTPSQAELWLTLRADRDAVLEDLCQRVTAMMTEIAEQENLDYSLTVHDPFPATVNDPDCAERVRIACDGKLLEVPMRWSEDFGYFLQNCKGAFFGIGAGESQPPLHNPHYDYPDELLAPSIQAFLQIIESIK